MQSNTPVTPPGQEKFTLPTPPVFGTEESHYSALSLLAFLVVSMIAIRFSTAWPQWAVVPFWFTAFGSGIGLLQQLSGCFISECDLSLMLKYIQELPGLCFDCLWQFRLASD